MTQKLLLEHNPIHLKKRSQTEISIIKLATVEAISDHVAMLRELNWQLDSIQINQFSYREVMGYMQ